MSARKPGSIHPGVKARVVTRPDWRGREVTLQIQRSTLGARDRALVVDDWSETGSQAAGAKQLIEVCGAEYVGLSLLVDQLTPEMRTRLEPVRAVADAAELRAG